MKNKLLLIASACLSLTNAASANDSANDSDLCSEKFESKSYNEAAGYCKNSCSHDNEGDCTSIGVLYQFGLGVQQDYQQAEKFYAKACSLNDATGCNNLGQLYNEGLGVKQDYSQAKIYFEKACSRITVTAASISLLFTKKEKEFRLIISRPKNSMQKPAV